MHYPERETNELMNMVNFHNRLLLIQTELVYRLDVSQGLPKKEKLLLESVEKPQVEMFK